MDKNDYVVDDLLNKKEHVRKNSTAKGKTAERELSKIFAERFKIPFPRVVGSGNRYGQTPLTEQVQKVMTSDLVSPENFRFSIEAKCGYSEIDICSAIDGDGNKTLDSFLEQAARDAERIKKKPMLCWKKDHRPWVVFMKLDDTQFWRKQDDLANAFTWSKSVYYKGWVGVSLKNLLHAQPDEFFFYSLSCSS